MTVVGILCDSTSLAGSLAREFGVLRPLLLSPSNVANALSHEENLSVVMVDGTQWPLDVDTASHVIPALAKNLGYLIHLERVNPLGKVPVRKSI